jgi:hypothetical protein
MVGESAKRLGKLALSVVLDRFVLSPTIWLHFRPCER